MAEEIFRLGSQQILLETLKNLPPEIYSSFNTLITILKTIGIVFLIYLIFLIVNIIMNIRRNLMIKKIYEKVNAIEEKLNKVIKKRKNKRFL